MFRTLAFVLAASAAAADVATRADEFLTAETKAGRFSGSVLIARDGKALLRKGYGLANREHQVANGPQTRFRLGSISKQFTAAAILLLEERGKLKVEDGVCRFVEPCPEAWQRITIHHLLTHSSGIPNFTAFPDYQKTKTLPATAEQMIARFRDKPLAFAPGERASYSNSGYALLGHIVEKASGSTYARFLRENIFETLGMADSGEDQHRSVLPHRATGYGPLLGNLVNADYIDMTIPLGAGSLYSTVDDLYKWDQALYGERLLKQAALDRMFRSHVKMGPGGYGYGWGIGPRNSVFHGGGIDGFATLITRYPGDRAVVIALSNFQHAAVPAIGRELESRLFTQEWPRVGNDAGGTRYSTLAQIDRGNVARLRVAWTWRSGDADPRSTIECTPIVVDGVMYVTSPALKVVALDPSTGREIWRYDPYTAVKRDRGAVNRGVAYWTDGAERRILIGTPEARLISLDARTGKPDPKFGSGGVVDLRATAAWDVAGVHYGVTSAPAIFEDRVIVGFTTGEGPGPSGPGDVRAFEVRTGREAWRFRTVPGSGELGHDTWAGESWKRRGGANAWGGITVDEARGMVFAGLGSAAFDFYGGDRKGR
ncbi:MAG: serine hydrolase, partial [Bryobacteraceae bacterium]